MSKDPFLVFLFEKSFLKHFRNQKNVKENLLFRFYIFILEDFTEHQIQSPIAYTNAIFSYQHIYYMCIIKCLFLIYIVRES